MAPMRQVPHLPRQEVSIRSWHEAILYHHFPARKQHSKPPNTLSEARNLLPVRMLARSDPAPPARFSSLPTALRRILAASREAPPPRTYCLNPQVQRSGAAQLFEAIAVASHSSSNSADAGPSFSIF